MATVSDSKTRARLGVPGGHDYPEEIESAGTPSNEAQLISDWETPVDDGI